MCSSTNESISSRAALAHRRGHVRVRLVDRPDDRPGTPEVCLKARAFLLTDGDHLEGATRLAFLLEERLHGGKPRDNAEGAVEPAAVTNRVDVRSGNDALSFISAFRSTPQVADRISPRLESGVFQPAFNAFDRGRPRGAIQRPVGSSIGLGADRVELIETALEQRAVNSHGSASRTVHSLVRRQPCRLRTRFCRARSFAQLSL